MHFDNAIEAIAEGRAAAAAERSRSGRDRCLAADVDRVDSGRPDRDDNPTSPGWLWKLQVGAVLGTRPR
jgi:hypothetical protein